MDQAQPHTGFAPAVRRLLERSRTAPRGGAGSEHGNFVSQPESETTGPGGVHCVIYVWDRPLTAQTALRLRSSSCEQPGHPGLYIANELERLVIPRSSSTLDQTE